MWPWLVANVSKTMLLWGSIAFIIGGEYVYIRVQSNKINVLQIDKSNLEAAVAEQQKTIAKIQEDYDAIIKAKEDHQVVQQHVTANTQQFNQTLQQKLTEQQLNKITEQVLQCLEISTGAIIEGVTC